MTTAGGPIRRVSAWNIANYLTNSDNFSTYIFTWLIGYSGLMGAIAGIMIYDYWVLRKQKLSVDGDLARSRGLVTDFGKVVDPIADKLLVTMALVALSTIALVPWWITVLILVREWGVTAVRFWVIRHGVMAAGRGGKLKTMLQAMALGLYILPLDLLPLASVTTVIAFVLLLAALVVTAVTGVDYVIDALRLRQTSERAAMKRARRAGQGGS